MEKSQAKILLVDDNNTTRSVILEYLELEGYHIFEARHGDTAIHLMDNARIDLVITDLFMTEGDGMKVVLAANGKEPRPKIIVISGAASANDYFEQVKGIGVDASFTKPVDLGTLAETVKKLLKNMGIA